MKLKERVLIAIMAGVVLLTVVLVLDVETKLQTPKQKVASHGRVLYNSFRHRHLQKTSNGSRENAASQQVPQQSAGAGEDAMSHHPEAGGLNDAVGGAQPPPSVNDEENMINTNNDNPKKKKKSHASESPPDPFDDLYYLTTKVERLTEKTRYTRKHWNPSIGELLGIPLR